MFWTMMRGWPGMWRVKWRVKVRVLGV